LEACHEEGHEHIIYRYVVTIHLLFPVGPACGNYGMTLINLHLGETLGDLLRFPIKKLQTPVDFLIAGPPCPPWSGQGCKKSLKDARADVFLRIIAWALFLIGSGGLIGVVLENVPGILTPYDRNEPAITLMMRVLRKCAPEFHWKIDILKAVDYLLPQTRKRVFLRGLRASIFQSIPSALKPFGRRDLRDVLGKYPSVDRRDLTSIHFSKNIHDFESTVRNRVFVGKLKRRDIVCVSIDRATGRIYKQGMSINVAPTLTTKNVAILKSGVFFRI
jgi:site-specific DNA-cytosine methylase